MANWVEYIIPEWRGLHFGNLTVDHAYLYLKSYYNSSVWIYFLSNECYTCSYEREVEIASGKHKVLKLDISRPISISVFDKNAGKYVNENETSLCDVTSLSLGEFGVYNMSIFSNSSCHFVTDKEPVNTYLPILLVCFITLFLAILIGGSVHLYKKYARRNTANDPQEDSDSDKDNENLKNVKKRLSSLDTFRGISIALMIFVNSGGGHYWWIEHATWNGLHVADIVFPSFLWIMGVCIPISIKSQINRGHSKKNILKKILWRSFKLFCVGICLNSINGPKLEELRIMGVLQRFGIAYLVIASLHTIFITPQDIPQTNVKRIFFDMLLLKFEYLINLLLIVMYLVFVFAINAPGCPRGYLGPGGKHNWGQYFNCTGGIIGYIDKIILTENHIYQHSTAGHIYGSLSFDPEGIFGCILTIVQVFIGVQCGITLRVYSDWKSKITRWIIWSIVLGVIGGVLCNFSKENGWIPINKNLWSLSFVFVTSSIAFIILTIFYLIIDVKPLWSGSPFKEAGMNSILMYVGHTVAHKMLPWHWRIGNMNTHFVLLLESLWNTILWVQISVFLYEKAIFFNL